MPDANLNNIVGFFSFIDNAIRKNLKYFCIKPLQKRGGEGNFSLFSIDIFQRIANFASNFCGSCLVYERQELTQEIMTRIFNVIYIIIAFVYRSNDCPET